MSGTTARSRLNFATPRRLPLVVAALAAVASLGGEAAAATYKLVTLEFPPLEYEEPAATPGAPAVAAGAAVELVTEIMKSLGHEVTVEVLPWVRSLSMTKEGKADAIFTAYKNAERETFLDYGNEILIPQVISLYAKKGGGKDYKGDLKALTGKTVGILNTISYGLAFDKARTEWGLKTERVEGLDLNFKKLASGRIDYVISNRYSAEVEIARLKMEGEVEELSPPVEVTPSYIAFSKKNGLAALRDAFDGKLKALKASGRYQEILAKYKVRTPK